jgi:hypothetical protein
MGGSRADLLNRPGIRVPATGERLGVRRCRVTEPLPTAVAAAESQRAAMLDIKAAAMDPDEAAEVVFDQSAQDAFYLLTQPEYVGSAMAERANTLTTLAAPKLRTTQRFDPAQH